MKYFLGFYKLGGDKFLLEGFVFSQSRFYPNLTSSIPVVDIFAGAGGFSEGFSSFPNRDSPLFQSSLSIEMNLSASLTLKIRKYFRSFPPSEVPESYYSFIQEPYLIKDIPKVDKFLSTLGSSRPLGEVLLTKLGDGSLPLSVLDSYFSRALEGSKHWVLLGGPPCQAFSFAGRRGKPTLVGNSLGGSLDSRIYLFREYASIVARYKPSVFIVENVPGMLSLTIKGANVFSSLVSELSNPIDLLSDKPIPSDCPYTLWTIIVPHRPVSLFRSYRPPSFVAKMENYGIPQTRHRVIIIGIRHDIPIEPSPLIPRKPVSVSEALAGLPTYIGNFRLDPLSRTLTDKVFPGSNYKTNNLLLTPSSSDKESLFTILREVPSLPWFLSLYSTGYTDVAEDILSTISCITSGNCPETVSPSSPSPSPFLSWISDPSMSTLPNDIFLSIRLTWLYRFLLAKSVTRVRGRFTLDMFPKELFIPRFVDKDYLHRSSFGICSVANPDGFVRTITSTDLGDTKVFIHHSQGQMRNYTYREYARIQTFPDNYYFFGSLDDLSNQIGNAVPPLFSWQLAEIVAGILDDHLQPSP